LGDAFVISSDDDFGKFRGEFATFPYVLDERFSCDEMKGLTGEAGGAPASRKDADDVRFRGRK
jgi:hypothetical protein